MRDRNQYAEVTRHLEAGLSTYAVAHLTAVPRSTVQRWRHRSPRLTLREASTADFARAPAAYCYLLGLYLGDGHIQTAGGNAMLRLTLDGRYPAVIEEAASALHTALEPPSVGRYLTGGGAWVVLQVCTPRILPGFPQHGRGPKHKRAIELVGWQRELTHCFAGAFLRGLIHSDGCRSVNRFKTQLPSGRVAEYEYVRYFFSNLSADIRRLFCEHCDVLGVHWTQSNPRNISVARKDAVAQLERLVGPKR